MVFKAYRIKGLITMTTEKTSTKPFAETTATVLVGGERMSRLGLVEQPMAYVDGLDYYQYETDNPIDRLDPSGLTTIIVAFRGLFESKDKPEWRNAATSGFEDVDYHEYNWTDEAKAFGQTISKLKDPIPGTCKYNTIVVIGHSFGGESAYNYAKQLDAQKIKVDGIVTADPRHVPGILYPLDVLPFDEPKNVFSWFNFYEEQQLFIIFPPVVWELFGAKVHGPTSVNWQLHFADASKAHWDIAKDPAVLRAIHVQVQLAGKERSASFAKE